MNAIQYFSEHIQLLLARSIIADTHRSGAIIAAQVRQLLLWQVTFATDPIHNLQILAIGERETA